MIKDKLALFITLISFFALSACQKANSNSNFDITKTIDLKPAEIIEVLHFHSTAQCWSCITVGEYAKKAIETNFEDEYQKGIVTYQDINIDSPGSQTIVAKYKATGSALFINAIVDGQDHIQEDVTVWRLVSNQRQYTSYLTQKINDLLGK